MKYRNLILAFVALWVAGCSSPTLLQQNVNEVTTDILVKQANSWNRGDMAGYMAAYWKSDSLQFITPEGVTYGWDKTLQKYQTTYPDAAAMGKLGFDVISVRPIGANTAYVVGKWNLQRGIGDRSGYFTLLMRRFPEGWRIVADHSS
ncbi:MAG TPA: nuclear transport factor 2 family protein [Adhaeribacter sp.]|nr:nuclear transport factor 2 family protein [Adhaeribacter sp.]